jgi:hypothetical protein
MAATRVNRTTKPAPDPAAPAEPHEADDLPTFTTTKQQKVKYDGPALMRIDGADYRMRSDRSFTASLVYLRRLGDGASVRQAQFALLDYVAGPEAVDKFIQAAELDPEAWNKVVNRALEHVLGKLKEDSGN